MEANVLLQRAKTDVYCAANLAVGFLNGYLKLSPLQFLEMYCILREWQDKMGNNVPPIITKLIEQIIVLADEIKEALEDCYRQYKELGNAQAPPSSAKPNDEQKQKDDVYSYFLYFPTKNGIVS